MNKRTVYRVCKKCGQPYKVDDFGTCPTCDILDNPKVIVKVEKTIFRLGKDGKLELK